MIYIDPLRPCVPNGAWRWTESCHMFTDPGNLDELHAFAAKIGLKLAWFQNRPGLPHYDLNVRRRQAAVKKGAVEVGLRQTADCMRAWRIAQGGSRA